MFYSQKLSDSVLGTGLDTITFLLLGAAEQGFTSEAESLITKGADVNGLNVSTAKTALALASENGHMDMVRLLINNGADVNGRRFYDSPLELAVKNGRAEIVALLLENGAKVNKSETVYWEEKSALNIASEKGYNDTVEILLQNGALVNDVLFESSLMCAVRNGHTDVIETLIVNKANIDFECPKGFSVLETSLIYGKVAAAKLLVEKGARLDGALYQAITMKCTDIINILINKDVKHKDENGQTMLIIAAKCGEKELTNHLIVKGSDIDEKDNNGMTALMYASNNGHKDVVENLMEHGAGLNEKSHDGMTALMYAAQSGYTDIAKLLLDNGADLNMKTMDGDTALILATTKEHATTVEVLIDMGADFKALGKDGLSARQIAMFCISDKEIMNMFTNKKPVISETNEKVKEHKSIEVSTIISPMYIGWDTKNLQDDTSTNESVDSGDNNLCCSSMDVQQQTKLDETKTKDLSEETIENLGENLPIVKEQEAVAFHENHPHHRIPSKKRKHLKRKRNQLPNSSQTNIKGHGSIIKDNTRQAPSSDQGDDPYKERHSTVFDDNSATATEDSRGSKRINTPWTELTENAVTACEDVTGTELSNLSLTQLTDNADIVAGDKIGTECKNIASTRLTENTAIISKDSTGTECVNLSLTKLTDHTDIGAADKISTKCRNIASTELIENAAIAFEEDIWMECTNVNETLSKCITEKITSSNFSTVVTESLQSHLKTASEVEQLTKNVNPKQNEDSTSDEATTLELKTDEWPEWVTSIMDKILQQLSEFSNATKLGIFDTGQSQLYPVIIKLYHIEHVDYAKLQNPLYVNIKDVTYCVIDEKT